LPKKANIILQIAVQISKKNKNNNKIKKNKNSLQIDTQNITSK